jgi:poly [ADP-ribose] polymerase
MAQFKYLLRVSPDSNNNKYYCMKENTDGTFTATYGRVGCEKPATEIYPMSKWTSKLNEKLSPRKGYQDQTDLFAEVKAVVGSPTGNVIADDATVANLIVMLQGYAKANTAKTYLVQAESVTKLQIERAQGHIDVLVSLFKDHFGKPTFSFERFNKELVALFTTIPRKMREVGEELLYEHKGYFDRALGAKKYIAEAKKSQTELKAEIEKLIETEQSNLDTMASQIPTAASDAPAVAKGKTLIETLGLKLSPLNDKAEMAQVKTLAQNHAHRVLKVYKIENVVTQSLFDKHLDKATNKKTELFWHGSRNQNWWWIIQQGLKIRPSNAVFSGAMFDSGVYFASESDKSMGYTDGGRWTGGGSGSRVFMALYHVHVGRQLEIHRHDSSCYTISKKVKANGYDSVWAKKGTSLYRDEFIVYNSNQSTIKYLIEFSV